MENKIIFGSSSSLQCSFSFTNFKNVQYDSCDLKYMIVSLIFLDPKYIYFIILKTTYEILMCYKLGGVLFFFLPF